MPLYNSSSSGGSANTVVDAKGDLLAGTADNTLARLAAGTDNYGLVADSTQTTGLNYKAVAGAELGYAEITSGTTSTTTNSFEDLTGLSVTVTVGARPIVIWAFFAAVSHSAAGGNITAKIFEGATGLQASSFTSTSANYQGPIAAQVRLAPSAGSHTYKLAWASNVAGTHTLTASSSQKTSIQVVEV